MKLGFQIVVLLLYSNFMFGQDSLIFEFKDDEHATYNLIILNDSSFTYELNTWMTQGFAVGYYTKKENRYNLNFVGPEPKIDSLKFEFGNKDSLEIQLGKIRNNTKGIYINSKDSSYQYAEGLIIPKTDSIVVQYGSTVWHLNYENMNSWTYLYLELSPSSIYFHNLVSIVLEQNENEYEVTSMISWWRGKQTELTEIFEDSRVFIAK